jgi:predicted acyltransferase (DUF342 family)
VDLVVRGKLLIGEGSQLLGSVKGVKAVVVEDGVTIEGALVSGRQLRIGDHCRIGGPLLAERDMKVGANCRIGSEDKPTTLSAEWAEIGAGSIVHGSVWAHRWGLLSDSMGTVEAASA